MRRLRVSAFLAGAALILSACGQAATPSPAPATSTPSAATSAPPPAAIELTVLEHQDPRINELKALLPKFEAAMKAQGKNITAKLLEGPAPDSEFRTKLTLDYNAGNAADVTSYPSSWVPGFASAGFLLDLTDRLNGGIAEAFAMELDAVGLVSRGPHRVARVVQEQTIELLGRRGTSMPLPPLLGGTLEEGAAGAFVELCEALASIAHRGEHDASRQASGRPPPLAQAAA